jgi:acetoin:2,6-dichlorophenolindophenol oxidoreductase subunit alpha
MTVITEPDAQMRVALLRWMIRARYFDDVMNSMTTGWHPSKGEEAVPVGVFTGLQPDDISVSHFRSAMIASMVRGGSVHRMLAGVCGRVTGPTRGLSRCDYSGELGANHLGMFSGTLGPPIGYAVGAGLAAKLKRSNQVVVVTFGDGTVNAGLFHESMNLAAMLCLPVVFVCQDNQYAISMRSDKAVAGSVSRRGAGYGMPVVEADGNDAIDVYDKVQGAIAHARAGKGPTFVHAQTYRMGGHWSADQATYRTAEEVAYWAARDPIARLSKRLLADGLITEADVATMETEARRDIDASAEKAKGDPWPTVDLIPAEAYAPSH